MPPLWAPRLLRVHALAEPLLDVLPVPLAGVAMIIFEIEALYNHIKSIFVKEEV